MCALWIVSFLRARVSNVSVSVHLRECFLDKLTAVNHPPLSRAQKVFYLIGPQGVEGRQKVCDVTLTPKIYVETFSAFKFLCAWPNYAILSHKFHESRPAAITGRKSLCIFRTPFLVFFCLAISWGTLARSSHNSHCVIKASSCRRIFPAPATKTSSHSLWKCNLNVAID